MMNSKISVPRWVCCAGVGMSAGFVYFVATLLLSHRTWYHKIGDRPAASQWLDAFDMVIGDFPFGHWISDGKLSYLASGLFWAILSAGIYSLHIRRRPA